MTCVRASAACPEQRFRQEDGQGDHTEEYRAFVKQQLFDGRHGGGAEPRKDMILVSWPMPPGRDTPAFWRKRLPADRCRSYPAAAADAAHELTTYLSQIHETRESCCQGACRRRKEHPRPRHAADRAAGEPSCPPMRIDKQLAERRKRPKRRWKREARQAPISLLCAATRASARLPTGSSTTPHHRRVR